VSALAHTLRLWQGGIPRRTLPAMPDSLTSAASLLATTGLFHDLDAETLRGLAERSIQRRYRRGQLIVSQGDPGDSLFVIAEGLVKVTVSSPDGEEMVLITLGPGETFGELALVDGGPRSASVEAIEPTEVLVLGRKGFFELVLERPGIVEGLLHSLGGLIRRLTDQTADFVFLDLHGRVAKLLLTILAERGVSGDGEASIDLPFTQTEIANMVGGSRQSVNQILRSFEEAGHIEITGHRVRLLRLDALRRRAGTA
jgi:CRP/FNR family transcriptional regulator, cyclic AMP receptor protein